MNPTCATCRWYHSPGKWDHECRRHAPIAVIQRRIDYVAMGTTPVIAEDSVAKWPPVHENLFCGEHEIHPVPGPLDT
jgi:hypothetical protein